jgi:hypothetical protein
MTSATNTGAGIYYTNMMDGIRADAYFTDHLHEGWTIEIKQMNNFYPGGRLSSGLSRQEPGRLLPRQLSLWLNPEEKK